MSKRKRSIATSKQLLETIDVVRDYLIYELYIPKDLSSEVIQHVGWVNMKYSIDVELKDTDNKLLHYECIGPIPMHGQSIVLKDKRILSKVNHGYVNVSAVDIDNDKQPSRLWWGFAPRYVIKINCKWQVGTGHIRKKFKWNQILQACAFLDLMDWQGSDRLQWKNKQFIFEFDSGNRYFQSLSFKLPKPLLPYLDMKQIGIDAS